MKSMLELDEEIDMCEFESYIG